MSKEEMKNFVEERLNSLEGEYNHANEEAIKAGNSMDEALESICDLIDDDIIKRFSRLFETMAYRAILNALIEESAE